MINITDNRLETLRDRIAKEQQEPIIRKFGPSPMYDENPQTCRLTDGQKYIKIDTGIPGQMSGKYMLEKENGIIYGIKGYGVINKKKIYGSLDTIEAYYWGEYTAIRKPAETRKYTETDQNGKETVRWNYNGNATKDELKTMREELEQEAKAGKTICLTDLFCAHGM